MARRISKNRKAVLGKYSPEKVYTLEEAAKVVKEITFTKFDSSVDLDIRLGVDPKKSDQMVRGVVSLPHGIGKVVRVLAEDRLIVSGINMIKKHQKPNPQLGVAGGIVEKEAAIHASNVAIYNAATKKADRVGFKVLENGDKVRVFKSNGETLGA